MEWAVKHFGQAGGQKLYAIDLSKLASSDRIQRLPISLRVLLENIVRSSDRNGLWKEQAQAVIQQRVGEPLFLQIPRVIMPDSSGVPILMDLAAMRDALVRQGGDPYKVDARVRADLVVDHSLQVDASGSRSAFAINAQREFERNSERYVFLKWAQSAFNNLTIHPPGSGIIHQLNLETIAPVVSVQDQNGRQLAFPDMVVGSDSHTPMINALGVVGWGVGGIEAETTLLGQPYVLTVPATVGVRIKGRLRPGVTTTDLALTVTERLRRYDMVGKFVEFFGPSVPMLSVPDRATLSNMAPEYGATIGFWAIDDKTMDYLGATGRSGAHLNLIEQHARSAGFWADASYEPQFDEIIEIDLGEVSASMAGPSRPQDRIDLDKVAQGFRELLVKPRQAGGFAVADAHRLTTDSNPGHGAVVIAAITSCTNTSNPSSMVRAGLLAKRAHQLGLLPKSWVKTSLAPGSQVVTKYLEKLGLMHSLSELGFDVVGYGCTTCGGKSGPLLPEAERLITETDAVAVSVLSGNRNFSGRIHKLVQANYLGSPALVVAYALAGRIDIEWEKDAIGYKPDGGPVYLADLWPSDDAVDAMVREAMDSATYKTVYADGRLQKASTEWEALDAPTGPTYIWDSRSSYLLAPPFLQLPGREPQGGITKARILGLYGHSLTTDHVSPGGEIPADSPAGVYLRAQGIAPKDFNTYVGRRGNHEVMARATFANLRIQNRLVSDRDGWWSRSFPDKQVSSVHEVAARYRASKTPMIVIGGREYGTGSSRDWAAKGPALLGVQAVLAISFERIHRANLAALGIVPLIFVNEADYDLFDGSEVVSIPELYASLHPYQAIRALVQKDGVDTVIELRIDLRNDSERQSILSGNVLKAALDQLIA